MKCPHCNETLLMTERHNIEIDYCPNCRGIWLDKGELDKMLQYVEDKVKGSNTDSQPQQPTPGNHSSQGYQGYQQQQQQPPYKRYDDDDDDYKYNPNHPKRKKKGFLGDLFDFD